MTSPSENKRVLLAFFAGWMAATLFTVIAAGAVPALAAIAASALMMAFFLLSAFAYNRVTKRGLSDKGAVGEDAGDKAASATRFWAQNAREGERLGAWDEGTPAGGTPEDVSPGVSAAWGRPDPEAASSPQNLAVMSVEERCELYAKTYGLTPRQGEVCLLLVTGKSVGDIADELYISKDTVKTHVKSLYAKTGAHSRQELIAAVYGFED